MTWEQIKLVCSTIYSQYVGSGKIIDDNNGDTTTPSSLAIIMDLVSNSLASYPLDFDFAQETGTITLDGSTYYDLTTLFPGIKSVYQIYGINDNQDQEFFSNREGNITPYEGYTIRGKKLYFTGTNPNGGTAKIQYKTNYLVKSAAGVRQKYFLNDDDYTVLDDDQFNYLIFSLVDYINWKSDSETKDRKDEIKEWKAEAWRNILLANQQTKQITSML